MGSFTKLSGVGFLKLNSPLLLQEPYFPAGEVDGGRAGRIVCASGCHQCHQNSQCYLFPAMYVPCTVPGVLQALSHSILWRILRDEKLAGTEVVPPRHDGTGICISPPSIPCACARGSHPEAPETAVFAFSQCRKRRGSWVMEGFGSFVLQLSAFPQL